MSINYEASPEKIAQLMGGHIEEILQKEIAHLMTEKMKPIIEEASTTIAHNLRSTVAGMRDWRTEEIVLLLKIDGVETAIAAANKATA